MKVAELAERAAGHAGRGALTHVTRERSLMLRFADGRPTQATSIDDVTVLIACAAGGQVGRASTNGVDDESLAACAARARRVAEAAARAGEGSFPGFADPSAAEAAAGLDESTAALEPEPGGAALAAAFDVGRERGVSAHGIWTVAEDTRAVATDGAVAAERNTDGLMKVICIAPGGRSGYGMRTSIRGGDLRPREVAESAAAKALLAGEPAELPAGEYPVVFEPHAVGWLLDLLGSAAFNGLAHAEGRGALAGRLGSTVAAPAVNLSDSPRNERTLPRSFDSEGTRKRPLPLIQDGVAHRVVHDIRSGALEGAGSTGHALAPGGAAYGPHPTNLVLAGGGAADQAELCAGVDRGIYVTRLWYANVVRPKETLITAVTRDGTFLIEDGEVTRPLRDLRLTDSVLSLLSGTQALTRGQALVSDGEFYGRRFAAGVVCPGMRAASVRFTGPAG